MEAVAAAGPDVAVDVGVDAVGEAGVAVGEDSAAGEKGGVEDGVGVDCGWAGLVGGEVLGACVGYVEGLEVGGEFLGLS